MVVVPLTVAGFALRWAFGHQSGIWRDEALFLFLVHLKSVSALVEFLRFHEAHPPLYYFVVRAWLGLIGDTEGSALLLSVLLGTAMIPLLYTTGRRLFDAAAGLCASALGTVAYTLCQQSGFVRPYAFLPLLCVGSTYFLWSALFRSGISVSQRRTHALLYILLTAALIYTHNFGLFILASEWLTAAVCFLLLRRCGFTSTELHTALAWFALMQAGVLLLYAPWLPTFLAQKDRGHNAESSVSLVKVARYYLDLPISSYKQTGAALWIVLAAVLIGFAIKRKQQGIIPAEGKPGSEKGDQILAAVVLGCIPLFTLMIGGAASLYSNVLLPRTIAILVPDSILLFSYLLVSRLPRLAGISGRAVAAILISLLALSLQVTFTVLGETSKSNAREAAAFVAANGGPNDLIVICPEVISSSFNWYFQQPNEQIDYPNEHRIEAILIGDSRQRYTDTAIFARIMARLEKARAAGQTVWFVYAPEWMLSHVQPNETVPPDVLKTPMGEYRAQAIRTAQLSMALVSLYGQPSAVFPTRTTKNSAETLVVAEFRIP